MGGAPGALDLRLPLRRRPHPRHLDAPRRTSAAPSAASWSSPPSTTASSSPTWSPSGRSGTAAPTACGSPVPRVASGPRASGERGARAGRRGLLPAAVRPRERRRAARPAGPLLTATGAAHQPWTRRASATTRSKRARSSAAPSRRTRGRVEHQQPVQAHLARPAAGVPGAGADVGPDPAVARLVGGVPVVVLAGEHQRQQVAAAPADDEHRAVLAAAVALVVGHPRPHDLARDRAGRRRAGGTRRRVRRPDAGPLRRGAGGTGRRSGRPTTAEAARRRHPGTVRAVDGARVSLVTHRHHLVTEGVHSADKGAPCAPRGVVRRAPREKGDSHDDVRTGAAGRAAGPRGAGERARRLPARRGRALLRQRPQAPARTAPGSWPSAPSPTASSPGTCAPADAQVTQNSLPSGSASVTHSNGPCAPRQSSVAPSAEQPGDLGLPPVRAHAHVEVHPVLDRLRLRHRLEQHPRPAGVGGVDRGAHLPHQRARGAASCRPPTRAPDSTIRRMNASSCGSTCQPSASAHQSASSCGAAESIATWKSNAMAGR